MLQVKDAVKLSLNTFAELFPTEMNQDLRLEEVSLSPDETNWKVVVSYRNPDLDENVKVMREFGKSPYGLLTGTSSSDVPFRVFKLISIRAEDGSFMEIKSA